MSGFVGIGNNIHIQITQIVHIQADTPTVNTLSVHLYFTAKIECRGEQHAPACFRFRFIGNQVIIRHTSDDSGGTQMALLEQFGEPKRSYYEGQTQAGDGWKLVWENERLWIKGQLSFRRQQEKRGKR